jgi:short-subunit dehydrogenase
MPSTAILWSWWRAGWVDLSDVAAVIQLHERLREQGIVIDILINNAGHAGPTKSP